MYTGVDVRQKKALPAGELHTLLYKPPHSEHLKQTQAIARLMFQFCGMPDVYKRQLINCAYIGMILSVSRYTAHLEEQKEHDAQLQLQIETNAADSEAQAAAEPTAQILNSDAKFEDENDINKG